MLAGLSLNVEHVILILLPTCETYIQYSGFDQPKLADIKIFNVRDEYWHVGCAITIQHCLKVYVKNTEVPCYDYFVRACRRYNTLPF